MNDFCTDSHVDVCGFYVVTEGRDNIEALNDKLILVALQASLTQAILLGLWCFYESRAPTIYSRHV